MKAFIKKQKYKKKNQIKDILELINLTNTTINDEYKKSVKNIYKNYEKNEQNIKNSNKKINDNNLDLNKENDLSKKDLYNNIQFIKKKHVANVSNNKLYKKKCIKFNHNKNFNIYKGKSDIINYTNKTIVYKKKKLMIIIIYVVKIILLKIIKILN